MIRNLDRESYGYVEFKTLASYLCLLATTLPNEIFITGFEEELNDKSEDEGYISKANFLETASFFDISESSPHTESSKDRELSWWFY